MKNINNQETSLHRWVAAHQIFFVIISGLNLLHIRLERSLIARDEAGIHEYLKLCANLFISSASAFHLAGDFQTNEYEKVVRPSMPEGLSGLYSVEHAVLMNTLKRLRPKLRVLKNNDEFDFDYSFYLQGLNTAYSAHQYVCERFVHDESSLANKKKPGPEAIKNHYRVRALKNAGCPIMKS